MNKPVLAFGAFVVAGGILLDLGLAWTGVSFLIVGVASLILGIFLMAEGGFR